MSPEFQNLNLIRSVGSEKICCDRKEGSRDKDSMWVPFFILEYETLIMPFYPW